MAEYCMARYFAIAPKPSGFSLTEAASVPMGALTAWQVLFDHAKLCRGETILIHGGAGALGTFAIQLAHLFGADVTTTAAARDHDFVRHLGASHVIDCERSKFEDVIRDMDVVFDTVGDETLARSWSVLKPGGRMVTLVPIEDDSPDPRAKQAFFIKSAGSLPMILPRALNTPAGTLVTVIDVVV